MTWGLAQAGNRAGRTGRYLQWWESEPEWNAVTSALQNPYDAASFLHLAWVGRQQMVGPLSLVAARNSFRQKRRLGYSKRKQQNNIIMV